MTIVSGNLNDRTSKNGRDRVLKSLSAALVWRSFALKLGTDIALQAGVKRFVFHTAFGRRIGKNRYRSIVMVSRKNEIAMRLFDPIVSFENSFDSAAIDAQSQSINIRAARCGPDPLRDDFAGVGQDKNET